MYLNELVNQNLSMEKELPESVIAVITDLKDNRKGGKSWTSKNAWQTHRNTSIISSSRNLKPLWCFTKSQSTIFTYLYETLWISFTFYSSNLTAEGGIALSQLHELVEYFLNFDIGNYATINHSLFSRNSKRQILTYEIGTLIRDT